jgi:hypothetical protein
LKKGDKMAMTHRELLEKLDELSEEQLDLDVTVYDSFNQEYYPLESVEVCEEDDVLDSGHPVFNI